MIYEWARDFAWIDQRPTAFAPTRAAAPRNEQAENTAYPIEPFLGMTAELTENWGDVINSNLFDLMDYTGMSIVCPIVGKRQSQFQSQPETKNLNARLAGIKAAFGLNTAQLAKVLKTRRSNIYNWLSHPDTALHKTKLARLACVESLAHTIGARKVSYFGSPIGTPTGSIGAASPSLVRLLSSDPIDKSTVALALDAIATRTSASIRESARLTEMRNQGFEEVPDSDF
jgi:hypothetical protein